MCSLPLRVMRSDLLDQLSARHAAFVTTAMYMQHPRNDYRRWRHDWAEINRLVDEINRLVRLHDQPSDGPGASG